jgi:hypothetical protein
MLDPIDLEARLAKHAELTSKTDRYGWVHAPTRSGRRRRIRDRVAFALFRLAAWVDPEVLAARRRPEASSGRL